MIIFSPMQKIEVNFYIKQVFFEEGLFRYIGVLGLIALSTFLITIKWLTFYLVLMNLSWLYWFSMPWFTIGFITIIWSLLHLIGFRWPMVAATLPLGVILGWLMLWLPHPLSLLITIVIHFGIGAGGYFCGIIQKWIR